MVIWQKILEIKQMRPVLPEETWKHIDEFFRQTPEAPEKLPWVQEVLQKAVAEGEQRGALRERQQTLLRLLQHKFSQVPETIARQIEATEDPDRLNDWLDRILDAETLAEMGLDSE